MCGIAGIFSQELINIEYSKKEEIISKMVASIKHRGPDDDDIWISDCIALGHSRLSILDLSKKWKSANAFKKREIQDSI